MLRYISESNSQIMLWNHLKFSVRLFFKDGLYSVLNVIGLSLGLTCGIIVLLYLQNDLTYDTHHEKHERIYRLVQHLEATGADFNVAVTARELAPLLGEDLPELEAYVRFLDWNTVRVIRELPDGNVIQFEEENLFQTDTSVFSIFSHRFIEGSADAALNGPNKMVLNESTAKRYFKNESALGKRLEIGEESYEITAVIDDLPDNSHMKYDILIGDIQDRNWGGDQLTNTRTSELFWNPETYTFLLFEEGYDPSRFQERWPIIFEKHYSGFAEVINGKGNATLEPLSKIHFYSDKDADFAQGNINYVYTFGSIGVLIILLACINYMNLATARSVQRTGEIGIRKALGYSKTRLFFSILSEVMLSTVLALVLSLILSSIILYATPFNDLIGKNLELNFFENPTLLFGSLLLTLFIGIFSGTYPAIYIPSVPVVSALKGSFNTQKSGVLLRKSLIIFQFIISILVIICTNVMDNQIEYMRSTELGFEKDNVLLIGIEDSTVAANIPAIQGRLEDYSNITATTYAYGRPGMGVDGQVFMVESEEGMTQQEFSTIYGGPNYLQTMGIELLEGRYFDEDSKADVSFSYIINEAAARELGYEEPIGKKMTFFHSDNTGSIIGLVKDFHFESLHNPITPLVILIPRNLGGWLHVRVKGEDLPNTIAFIKKDWETTFPNIPFEYEFLDDGFNQQYQADERQFKLVSVLSYVCIIISILGLVGLSAFTAGQKTKEVGVRKALGANIPHIMFLFSKDYLRLIIIGFIISVPLANYLITEWLKGFAFQIDLNPLSFILPGVLVLMVSILAVSGQTLKAAKVNPVESLRSE